MSQTYNDAVPAITRNALEDLTAIRNNFAALKSCFSGPTAPPNPVAGMWWYDTTANMLKLRNEANSAWLNVYDFANQRVPLALLATNCSRTVLAGNGISVSGNLSSGNVTVNIAPAIYAQLQDYTAGTRYLWTSLTREYRATTTTLSKVFELRLDRGGTLRITFTIAGFVNAKARIYRNGSAVGTLRTAATMSDTYTQDISGWSAGDSLQIYAALPSGVSGYVNIKDVYLQTGNVYGMVETM